MSRRVLRAWSAAAVTHATALATLAAVTVVAIAPTPAAAGAAKPAAPVAVPGRGPQQRPLPSVAAANHGYPRGTRPPVVPPGVRAAGVPHKAAVADAIDRQAMAAAGSGAVNLILRPGFAFDDTSLVLYFDAADPGIGGWSSWRATVYDPDTGAAQDSVPLSAADATRCVVPAQYCKSFGAAQGWSLIGDHGYYVTITVTFPDGTTDVSAPSATVKARTTSSPPALPAAQAAGCTCGNALVPTTPAQAVRGSGVNTATGTFSLLHHDLSLPGFGVLFDAKRMYSSANTTAGAMGVGWSWSYDLKVIPPAAGATSVTVRAEDGAQVVYTAGTGDAYNRLGVGHPSGHAAGQPGQVGGESQGRLSQRRGETGQCQLDVGRLGCPHGLDQPAERVRIGRNVTSLDRGCHLLGGDVGRDHRHIVLAPSNVGHSSGGRSGGSSIASGSYHELPAGEATAGQ
jgi:hypothetical protein